MVRAPEWFRLCLVALVAGALGIGAAGCEGGCDPTERGVVCAVAGTGELGFNRDGRPPEESDFYLLSAVRRGPDERIYLMDFNNQRLRVIDEGVVQTVMGNGFHAAADVTASATSSPLENPIDFAWAPDGSLVFVSYHDPRVIRLTAGGGLEVIAGTGEIGARGNEGDFEEAIFAAFIQLDGIAIAPDGAIFVSDSLAHRVRVIRDGIIYPVAGTAAQGYAGDGGPAVDAALDWPTALALDAEGNLFVADTFNHVVRRISPEGAITTVAGDGTEGFSGDGGPATEARLREPYGLAVGDDGALYIADRGNFRVRRVRDGLIETLAGTGERGRSGDGGLAIDARFGYLARLSMDGDGLLVADQSNAAARRITLP